MTVTGDEFEVVGGGSVTVVEDGAITHTNLPDVEACEDSEPHDICAHVLPRGPERL